MLKTTSRKMCVVSIAFFVIYSLVILSNCNVDGKIGGDDGAVNVHRRLNVMEPELLGCYNDNQDDRALPQYIGHGISFDDCFDACASYGFHYFGLQSGEECWCGGKDVHSEVYAKHGPAENCDCLPGPVGQYKQCVYDIGHSAKRLGCFKDAPDDRAFNVYIGRNMSFKSCLDVCTSIGLPFIGRQSWGECWCGGNTFAKHGPDDSCRCHADDIGGYKFCAYEVPDFLGCYYDAEDRALGHYAGTDMTYEACHEACIREGYHFMGRQANLECWCGGRSPEDDVYDDHGEAEGCNCDDPYNIGKWKMCVHRVFQATFKGCYGDAAQNRALPHFIGNKMVYDECHTACKNEGYHFMGRQAWGECWCGGRLPEETNYAIHGPANHCECNSLNNIGIWSQCVYRVIHEQ